MAESRPSLPPRPDPPTLSARRAAAGISVIVIGVLGSIAACWAVRQAERGRTQAEFEQRAQSLVHLTSDGLKRHQDTLYALRNLFHFSQGVDRSQFGGAARELISRHVGVRALEWVRRVPGPHREAFEAAVRAEGFRTFEIRERVSGSTLRRIGPRPEYYPVTFIEPLAGNEPALGFDMQSGVTWPVLERIASTDELAASGRLQLLPTSADPAAPDWGYLMQLPVYERGTEKMTPTQRRARLRGYVLGIFHLGQTLESFFKGAGEQDDILDVLFIDRSAEGERQFLHYHTGGWHTDDPARAPSVASFQSQMHLRVAIDHAGRQWELWFRPRAEWLAARSQMRSWLTLALGLVVTGSAVSYVFGALRRERLVGRLVADRTAELRATQAALERDIRERHETERQLSAVIGQLPGAAFRCRFDENFTALFASEGMFQLTGYAAEDFTAGRVRVGDLAMPEDRPPTRAKIAAAVEQRTAFEFEYRIRDREGTVRWLLVRGRPVYADDGAVRFIEGLAIDITALKAAEHEKIAVERRLLEAQKLESLGVLAGGVAHDFNNLLTAMLGNANLARNTMPEGHPARAHLQHIEQAARRAADLCQQMLSYAGKREIRAKLMDVSDVVRSTTTLLRVSIHKNTRLELRLDEHLPPVLADAAQLQQIMMNLVINAADAIGEQPGEIAITTFQRHVEAAELRQALHQPELPSGLYVGLEVRDNGCGMSAETLARIFEPFFTTKFSGRGLGLASVLGIVQTHRGALFVESAVGRGSVFRLLLRAEGGEVPKPSVGETAGERRLSGTVLIVDDEDYVRDVLGNLLQRFGMTPVLAASGEEALRIYAEYDEQMELIMLDLTMPGLSGEETLRALLARNPAQRIILMSGYSDPKTVARCTALGVTDFIGKPFEMDVLLRKLQAVEDRSGSATT